MKREPVCVWIDLCGAAVTSYSAPDRGAEYCDQRVCLSVCLCVFVFVLPRSYLRNYTSDLHQVFRAYGRGSVLLCDTLCTSGFMDDVILAHKTRLLDVAVQLKRSAHAALSLATV